MTFEAIEFGHLDPQPHLRAAIAHVKAAQAWDALGEQLRKREHEAQAIENTGHGISIAVDRATLRAAWDAVVERLEREIGRPRKEGG